MNVDNVEKYRVNYGPLKSDCGSDFGLFFVPNSKGQMLKVLSSGWIDQDWFHVSASLPMRCPTWEEMCVIKELFFGDEIVIQYHPKKRDYINNHPFCLHLWMSMKESIPCPPSSVVGIKS